MNITVAHGCWPETQLCVCLINIGKCNTYWQCARKFFFATPQWLGANHTKHRRFNTPETLVSFKRLIHLCAAVTYLVNIDVYCGFLCKCENHKTNCWSTARYAHHDARIASLIILWILNSSWQWIWANPNLAHLCKQAILPPQRVS